MSWRCKIFGHPFGGFYMKNDKGEYYEPRIFDATDGKIKVYRLCARCGHYEKHEWG